MSDLSALETWVEPLLGALSPAGRTRIAARVAADLRRSQVERIRANRNPDGSAYAPRLSQARRRSGAIKRGAMFRKLATYLKSSANADSAAVTFSGRVGRIALVHQAGLTDQVRPDGPMHRYARRQLLGFGPADLTALRASILTHLEASLR